MKCLVTGGSGFIGSFIVEQLAREPDTEVVIFDPVKPEFDLPKNVFFVDGDTRYMGQVLSVMRGCEEVYDVAGVLGTSELLHSNARAVEVNILGAVNVLEAARQCGVKRVFHPTKPNDWLNTYSITKHSAEQFCLMFNRISEMDITVLKWFNAYGPRQHLYPVRKAVPIFIVQALRGRPLEVFGDGNQTVDMIYVSDIADIAIRTTRSRGAKNRVIDVGCGIPITVNELANEIIKACESKSQIKYLPMRPGEPTVSDIRADVTALSELVEMKELTSFEKGLRETVQAYRQVPDLEVDRAFDHFDKFGSRSWPI